MVCLYPTISTQWFSGFWSCPLTFFNKYSFIFLLIICYSHSIGFHISYIIFFFSVLCQLLGIIIRICSKRFILGISYIKIRIQFHKSLPLLSYFNICFLQDFTIWRSCVYFLKFRNSYDYIFYSLDSIFSITMY